MKFILAFDQTFLESKKVQLISLCVFKKTYFQLLKIINKDDNNDTDGSGSNNDNDVKDYGDSYDDSYSNHHEIYDYKDDNDDDNSDNNDQIMNAQITLHKGGKDFQI